MNKACEILMEEFGIGKTRAIRVAEKLRPAFREEDHFLDAEEMLDRNSDVLPENFDVSKLSHSDIADLHILYEDILSDEVEEGYIEQTAIEQWIKRLEREGVL